MVKWSEHRKKRIAKVSARYNNNARLSHTLQATVTRDTALKPIKDAMFSGDIFKEWRKEIRKEFQKANRRIQNIEKAGLYSPAYERLSVYGKEGFSKFGISQYSTWNELVQALDECESFLNELTSTAEGARMFDKQLIEDMGGTQAQFDVALAQWKEERGVIDDEAFIEENYNQYDTNIQGFRDKFVEEINKSPLATSYENDKIDPVRILNLAKPYVKDKSIKDVSDIDEDNRLPF